MRHILCVWISILVGSSSLGAWERPITQPRQLRERAPAVEEACYIRVAIAGFGPERLQTLKQQTELTWWVELDQTLLALTTPAQARKLASSYPLQILDTPVVEEDLLFVSAPYSQDNPERDGVVLAQGGRFAVLQLHPGRTAHEVLTHPDGEAVTHGCHIHAMPFAPNTVLAQDGNNQSLAVAKAPRADVQQLVDAVSGPRWLATIHHLALYDRISGSAGCNDAADWLARQFRKLPHFRVELQPFQFGSTQTANVIATLPGTQRPSELWIIGAHYDSIGTGTVAPGAEDNASGTAAVLEMARIFATYRPHATIQFICYSGEEQGLFGSGHHLSELYRVGEAQTLQTALIMDMIGYTEDADLDVLLETGTPGLGTLPIWSQAARDYTSLRPVLSTNPFGSDHMPYLRNGHSSLLTIENDYDDYPGYHRSTDTQEKITPTMGIETIKMNVAAMAIQIGFDLNTPVGSVFTP